MKVIKKDNQKSAQSIAAFACWTECDTCGNCASMAKLLTQRDAAVSNTQRYPIIHTA